MFTSINCMKCQLTCGEACRHVYYLCAKGFYFSFHLSARPSLRPPFPLLCNSMHNSYEVRKQQDFTSKQLQRNSRQHNFLGYSLQNARTRSMHWLFILEILFLASLGNGAVLAASIRCDQVKPVPPVERKTRTTLVLGNFDHLSFNDSDDKK